jgi:hypothetical protein
MWPRPREIMKKIGIALIFAGLGVVPLCMILVAILGSPLNKEDVLSSMAGAVVSSNGALMTGVALLWLDNWLGSKRSK